MYEDWKEKIKLSLFTDDMTVYIKNLKDLMKDSWNWWTVVARLQNTPLTYTTHLLSFTSSRNRKLKNNTIYINPTIKWLSVNKVYMCVCVCVCDVRRI